MSSVLPRAARHRPRGSVRASLAITLVAVSVAVGASATAPPAHGQGTDDVRIIVSQLSGVLGPGSVRVEERGSAFGVPSSALDLSLRVLVENVGSEPLDALRLVVEVHPPAASRQGLRQALSGRLPSPAIHVHDLPVSDGDRLEPGAIVGLQDVFNDDEVIWAEAPGGVHPVRIAVVRGTEVLDEVVTAVVWLAEEPVERLATTLVWPIESAPWRTVGGAYASPMDSEARPGSRLDVLVGSLERRGPTPVVLAPAAHLLEDLGERSDGFTVLERQDGGALESRTVPPDSEMARQASTLLGRIRELAADLPYAPVSGSYVDADLAALYTAGTPLRELAAEVAANGRRLEQQLGREVDAATFLLDQRVIPPVLDLLPGETLLLPSHVTLEPALDDLDPVPAPIRQLRTPSGRLVTAVLADPYLEEALAEPSHPAGPLLASQRVIAASAMAYLESPSRPDRTLLLLPPQLWDPSPTLAATLLDGLQSAAWLRMTTPGEQVARAPRASVPVGLAPPPEGSFSPAFTTALATATRQLDAAVSALPDGTSRIEDHTPTELRDILLRSTSSWYRGSQEVEALALIHDVQRALDTTFGDIEVASASVTLTSDTGSIPITLQRSRGGPITVAVEVASQGRLVWPEGRRSEPLVLEEGTAQTVSFPTRALSTGTFPVTVRVTDPSGAHELQATTLSVRSTAISGPALSATGLVVLALLMAGALRRRSRGRHLEMVD